MARTSDSPKVEQAKRRHILEAARAVLVRRGFQDVALDEVAKSAGVAKGTLFLYYRNKEELVSAAFSDLVERLGVVIGDIAASPRRGRERLDAVVDGVLTHLDENRDFMAQMGLGRLPGCGDRACAKLQAKFGDNHAAMVRVLEGCRDDGLLAEKNLSLAASFLFGLCRSSTLFYGFFKRGAQRSLESRRAEVVEMFLNGAGK